MAANPTACPPVGDLERLLAEDLRGADRDGVEAHVEVCGSCQEQLARLSSPTFHAAPPSAGGTGSDPGPGEHFMRGLRDLSPWMGDTSSHRPLPGPDAIRFPNRRLGRYEILERLAVGGMGTVYKARHTDLGKVVALKVLPAGELSEVSLARFKNEMRAIGRLHHPHIVAAHDAGEADGVHYLAMDFVEGLDLGRLVARHGQLPVPEACEAIRQAALGLQHAFEKGLVHRDVKPSNLMLARGGVVQVLDLGLARVAEDAPSERLTSKGALLGTTDYLAPEQVEYPHAADVRADIYSLGCTLYNLLAGHPPFAGERYPSILSRLRAHQEEPVPPITVDRSDVPAGLAAVLGRMLAKAPADRFQTPAEVAKALEPFTSGADVVRLLDATEITTLPAEAATTPGPEALDTAAASRRGRATRTRRWALPLGLAGLCAAVAVAAIIFWPKRNKIDPDPTPVAIDEFRINHYRGKEAKPLGDIRSSEPVKRGDDVRVFAKLNRPAYCYLIAFNPDGSEQLCYPAFDGSDPQSARAVVPPETTEFRFFPDDKGYFNLDTSGLQVFVLVVSSKPLPAYAEWRAGVKNVPWRAVWHGGDERWQFDGQQFARLSEDRGGRQERDPVPPPLRELCEFFKAQAGVDAVRAVAFPVAADDRAGRLKGLELELVRQERFEEAKEPVREMIALYAQEKGKDAWQTAEMRRELDAIERVASRSPEDRAEYVRGLKQLDAATALYKQGRYPEAVPLAEAAHDVIGKYLGPDDFITASVAVTYATLLRLSAKYKEAETVYRKALADVRRAVGDNHPYAASIRVGLALALDEQDKPAEVLPLLDKALEICRKIRGPDSPDEAIVLNNLAGHHERHARFGKAETFYRQSLDILTRSEGAEAGTTLVTRANLAKNLTALGKYREGEDLYREVIRVRLQTLPEDHPDLATVYNNLAGNLDEQERYAAAEWYYRRVLDIRTQKFGADNVLTAMSASNLGLNMQYQAKYEAAEPYFVDAIRVFDRTGFARSRQAGLAHNNLAANYRHRGRYADATKHVELALSILRERLSEAHPSVAECVNNLAANLADQKRFAEAETVAREAVAVLEKSLGKDHPLTVVARVNFANNLHNQAKYAEAGPILREAVDALGRLLGEGHPKTAWTYKNLITNEWAQGDYAAAAKLGPDARASFESARQRSSFGGLGRVSSTDELSPLRHLAACAARTGHPRDAWTYLEGGLARGLLDDLAVRRLTDDERAREQSLTGDVDKLNDRISELLGPPRLWWPFWSAVVARNEVEILRREREEAQGRLVKFQTDMADKHGVAAGKVYDLAEIQKALRPDVALVAWLDIGGDPTFKDPSGDHWVCVVRQTGEPVWERLPGTGPNDAWADADDGLPGKIRGLLATRADAAKGQWKDAAAKLYRQRLGPAESALGARDGLAPARHLIVLAASRIAGVPVEALVSDRFTVSYAPSGSVFAWLQAGPSRTESVAGRSFLGVANPDFGPALPDLKATLTEVHTLTRLFTRLELLTGAEAKASTLDKMAADGRLRQFRYLHFATHGQLDDGRPLASALVLAQEPATDGRLTAERVLHTWKLDAELVTLSACETALGKYSRGEGFLGFSQALFLAGARGTLLSLWPVDDRATTLLMTRFYENMLGTPDKVVKAMPTKADALAEAKRWLRDLTAEEVERLTGDMPRGLPSGTRGVRREAEVTRGADAPRPFAHPYFWSGFVLIGDAR